MTITLTNRRNSAETRVEADDLGEIAGEQLAAADRAVCRCEGRCRCFGVRLDWCVWPGSTAGRFRVEPRGDAR